MSLTKGRCSAFIAFMLFAIIGVQAQENRKEIIETWRCFAISDFSKTTVLIELTRRTLESEADGVGVVSVAEMTYPALFRVVGFDRRWDFGDEFNFAFLIEPSGSGRYYDFSSVEDGGSTKPSQHFNCVSP